MAVVTAGELLDRARDFEIQLESYYAQIRDHSADNGVRLLTYYLARHRRHQEKALAGLDTEALRRLRKVETKFDAASDPTSKLHMPGIAPDKIKGAELIEAAIRHDSALVTLYRTILAQPLSQETHAVLEALIGTEERGISMQKKMLAMHYF